MPAKVPLKVVDLKILRGQVYATLALQDEKTSTSTVQVKLNATHKGLSEALTPLMELVQQVGRRQLEESMARHVSEARLEARQEVAGSILGMIQRGTMPMELERALKPMAGPNTRS